MEKELLKDFIRDIRFHKISVNEATSILLDLKDIESNYQYAIKEGYIDEGLSLREQAYYYNHCMAYEPEYN